MFSRVRSVVFSILVLDELKYFNELAITSGVISNSVFSFLSETMLKMHSMRYSHVSLFLSMLKLNIAICFRTLCLSSS
jgi:hypothetical protein